MISIDQGEGDTPGFDGLKIDRSLVRDMQTDRAMEDIVKMTITPAHNMGPKTTAEGIESSRQMERLAEFACEYRRGYFFLAAAGRSGSTAVHAVAGRWTTQ